jgi:phosphoglycerate kinase
MEKADEKKVNLILPVDVVVAPDINAADGQVVDVSAIPDGHMALDIGPKTIALIEAACSKSKSVFWNGPMGMFENAAFSKGTFAVARAMAVSKAFTVVGGGDSASAVRLAGDDVARAFTHISTGGGASLELVEGRKLPGIEVLRTAE